MKAYIGAKIVQAERMGELAFLACFNPSEAIAHAKEGRIDRPCYHFLYPDGYDSWSPKEVFEELYRPVSMGEERIVLTGTSSLASMKSGVDQEPEEE